MARADISRALAAGLTFRPARGDGRDTLAWDRTVEATGRRSHTSASRRSLRPDKRIRVMREPQRGRYDRETIDAILDEALLCHLGFEVDGQPYVIPTLHARVGDTRLRARLRGEPDAAAARRRRARLPDRHALRRARARALGLQPLGQLPLGRPARDGDARRATTRSARRCARSPSSSRRAAGTRRGSRPRRS